MPPKNMAGPLAGPPYNAQPVQVSNYRLLNNVSWSDNWTQSSVRFAVLNHRAALFGGDSDGGRDDHSAHIGAHFWNVAGIGSCWETPNCDAVPLKRVCEHCVTASP